VANCSKHLQNIIASVAAAAAFKAVITFHFYAFATRVSSKTLCFQAILMKPTSNIH